MEEKPLGLFFVFPNFWNHHTPNIEKPDGDQLMPIVGKHGSKRWPMRGQGALVLKRTQMKQFQV